MGAAILTRLSLDGIPARSWAMALAALLPPMVLFLTLRALPRLDVAHGAPGSHFIIVGVVAGIALALAVAVAFAARHVPEARTFFLAMGFLSMAGIFFAHGAGTAPALARGMNAPGHAQTVGAPASANPFAAYAAGGAAATVPTAAPAAPDDAAAASAAPAQRPAVAWAIQVVGLSARLSLMVSALCFALAMVDFRDRIAARIVRHWGVAAASVLGLSCAYIIAALFFPKLFGWINVDSTLLSYGVASVAVATLAFAGWRCLQAYRLVGLPVQGTMALSMALLIEAQVFMLVGPVWNLSWWLYHVAMLVGFLAPVLAILWQYLTVGDLGAIVEGLFLRTQVQGLRAGDPAALTVLAAAVSAKDSETGEHITRVGDVTVSIASRLLLPSDRIEALRWAGRLHDVGRLGVPNPILRKPGKLTPEEFEVIKRHTVRGHWLAIQSEMLADVAHIIRAHHERIDGTGYPDGLNGAQIPIEARIVAVADVWDAITCDRPYRKAMPLDQAMASLRKESGPGLDPDCVRALFDLVEMSENRRTAA